jgi:alpha-methylacyl-CoA racemase
MNRTGPLSGLRVVEMSAIGPVPFAAMLLSDMGADVVRVVRSGAPALKPHDIVERGRRVVELDLKSAEGVASALALIEHAEILLEGFRPRVMERLGLGPDIALARNPRLVYGRMTGWGQQGPRADAAGHDIDYIAIAGVLHAIGERDRAPVPPLNLLGDFGGGGMYLVVGALAALLEARHSGKGQVVDCAMVDGAASLMSFIYAALARGDWRGTREANLLDGGAPFYRTYRCADGKYIAVGALEPQFHSELIERLGLDAEAFKDRDDPASWPRLRSVLEGTFAQRPRHVWCEIFEGSNACVAPVLDFGESARDPHMAARGTIASLDGIPCPAPAPRFSRTASTMDPVRPELHDPAAIAREWARRSR